MREVLYIIKVIQVAEQVLQRQQHHKLYQVQVLIILGQDRQQVVGEPKEVLWLLLIPPQLRPLLVQQAPWVQVILQQTGQQQPVQPLIR